MLFLSAFFWSTVMVCSLLFPLWLVQAELLLHINSLSPFLSLLYILWLFCQSSVMFVFLICRDISGTLMNRGIIPLLYTPRGLLTFPRSSLIVLSVFFCDVCIGRIVLIYVVLFLSFRISGIVFVLVLLACGCVMFLYSHRTLSAFWKYILFHLSCNCLIWSTSGLSLDILLLLVFRKVLMSGILC